jgi:hypothetical protein
MAFEGGPLSAIGISPEYLTGLITQTASSGVQQAIGQVWKGSGQSFAGQAAQSLGGALADSAVNVVLNSTFGKNVAGPQGLSLDSGKNILASVITPQVTGALSAGINEQIQKSLKNAGPFGPILSNIGTSLVDTAFSGISSSLLGGAGGAIGAGATNYKMFPGGGEGEAPADYGGSAYTLSDVVFSIQPANQGPQAFGDFSTAFSKSSTTLPFGDLINTDFNVNYPGRNDFLSGEMKGNFEVFGTTSGAA